ncbi:MAG TPA: branched-chain amino acid ABC transporter permease [Trueperaceae bacterium]|jgi:branched-chain amino acid transport system permease protein|nr:branched-chain amino acid ABC transporter permease [Trueperaceae bacterium]
MTWLRLAGVAVLGLAWFLLLPDYRTLGITLMLLAGWATAWDLLGGWSGQTSLGHAAFVGLGAYTIGITADRWDLAPWWGALLAMALAAVLALLWGKLTFRLRAAYFVLSTIAVAEILRLVAINQRGLTGGAIGLFIFDLERPFGLDLFSRTVEFWFALGYLVLVLAVAALLTRGRLGYQMRAVREDEPSAQAAGINPEAVKLWAFAISAALTALGGCLYGIVLSALQPQPLFELHLSVRIALVAIIGGRGTLFGPLVGATLLTVAAELFRNVFAEANLLIYGALIVVVVLFAPHGLVGELDRRLVRRRYARSARG